MAEPGGDVLAAQLAAELRHWRRAAHELTDLDMVAAPQAWAGLESYLGTSVRAGLIRSARAVATRADQLAAQLPGTTAQDDLARLRDRVLSLRQSYVRAETVLDFFGDAVATRTNPRLAELLRGLDLLAVDAMDRILGPLGIPVPPVLVYLDKGLGASILRAGIRLWDASLSPAAAIKITRHNLLRPTAVLHEVGHQVAHLTNWTDELATALNEVLAPTSPVAAEAWHGWASEVAADVVAFVLTGYAPVPALADVVDGTTTAVYRMPPGDPHPMGLLRVAFNAALCRYWYQAGPWDDLVRTWLHRHPLSAAPRSPHSSCGRRCHCSRRSSGCARSSRCGPSAGDPSRRWPTRAGWPPPSCAGSPTGPERRCTPRVICNGSNRCGSWPGAYSGRCAPMTTPTATWRHGCAASARTMRPPQPDQGDSHDAIPDTTGPGPDVATGLGPDSTTGPDIPAR